MRRSLQRTYWVGIGATLLMALIAVVMLVALKISDTRANLRGMLEAAAAWTMESSGSLQSHASNIAAVSPPARVTFLMDNGLVLADSLDDALTMENHYNRPEVRDALANGTGESLRLSDTQANFVLYVAKRVSPQLILRIGYPIVEITRLAMLYAVGLLVLFFVLYLVQRTAVSRFIRRLSRQMEDIRRLLEGEEGGAEAVFPELKPAVSNIAYLAHRLRYDLQEVNRTLSLRNDFVANASHELRSPLTSIMGFAEMLDEGLADTPQERDMCVKTIRSECERMLRVIEDILLLGRAERQPPQAASPVNIALLTGEICQALSFQAAQKGIALHREGALTLVCVEKDLWEILYNLIDNAIRYGKTGGWVRVTLGEGQIAVADNGIGVAEKHLPHLFEQFYRVDQTRDAAQGTGLGLSIVRTLAERNGGHVSVDSAPGKGARFVVRFDAVGVHKYTESDPASGAEGAQP